MDFELLDELVNGVGTLPQCGELLPCSHLSIRICKYKVNLSFKLIHHHWHPRRVEDLLDFMHHPCPGGSTLHDRMNSIWLVSSGNSDPHGICTGCTLP